MGTETPSMGDDRKVSQMTAAADSPSPQDRDTLENEISMKLQTRPSEPLMQENCLQERAQLRPSVSLEYEERYPLVKPSISLEPEERYPLDSTITQPNNLETEDDVKVLAVGYRNYRLDFMVGPTRLCFRN